MDYKFINSEYLESVSEGDPDIVNELVELFKEQSIEIYDEMNKFLTEKNFSMLALLAHKAKSSVAIMGMSSLADMLKTFEHQAKEGKDQIMYESYLKRFKTETDGAVRELEDLINNM